MTEPPIARVPGVYFTPSSSNVVVFSGTDAFNGWICRWTGAPGSVLVPMRQLDRVALLPDFDLADAIRRGLPLAKASAQPFPTESR